MGTGFSPEESTAAAWRGGDASPLVANPRPTVLPLDLFSTADELTGRRNGDIKSEYGHKA